MTNAEREAVQAMLAANNTMTLATSHDNKPWAATLFFTSDDDLNLYFVSDHRTRHAREVAESGEAVATVNPDCDTWNDVRGLQMEGQVSVVTGARRAAGIALYLAKFADVKTLFENPKSKDEETIAQRLKAANLYQFTPRFIRLIDNSRWFGFKQEFEL